MRSPVLSRKLVLETVLTTPDGAGGRAESWAVLGTMWGDVSVRSGRETDGASGAQTVTAFRITVRGAPVGASNRPIAGQRFRDGTRLFRILAVSEADRAGRYLTCYANEEAAT